jgi:hypothetical protein
MAVRAASNADVCNLYSITTNQAAITSLFRVINPGGALSGSTERHPIAGPATNQSARAPDRPK